MALEDASVWRVLGIAPTEDSNEIRRAYAKRLRAVHPEDDPEGFNELRLAYEAAAGWARLNGLRSIEDDLRSTAPRPTATLTFETAEPPSRDRPPTIDALTIDQMLDELALDERREPELERLRRELALALRPSYTPADRVAALERIFRSEAMQSSRLYAETESWVALLLRGSFSETEALLEPSIDFFGWSQKAGGVRGSHGERVLERRYAIMLRETFSDPDHRLHKALVVLQRPFLESYAMQYGLTFGLRRRVVELMKTVDGNREFECLLDYDAVAWWRRNLRGPGMAPFVFLGVILVPLAIARLATSAEYSDPDGSLFLIVWFTSLCGFMLLVGVATAVVGYIRDAKTSGSSWIEDLGDAAP